VSAADERQTFVAALRELADFFEQHPNVKVPYNTVVDTFVTTRDELAENARGSAWEKVYNGDWFSLRKVFGDDEHGVVLEVNCSRTTVCRRVVKGTRVIPARAEQVVEDVEWVCEDPVLQGGER